MKAFLKGFIVSVLIMSLVMCAYLLIHFMLYTSDCMQEGFENFFGVTLGRFNPIVFFSIWVVGSVILAIYIKSVFEEYEDLRDFEYPRICTHSDDNNNIYNNKR